MISLHIRHINFSTCHNIPIYPHVFHINGKSCYRKKKKTFLFSLHTYYLGHPIGKALFHDYGPPMFLRSPIISKLFNYFSLFFKHYIPSYILYILLLALKCFSFISLTICTYQEKLKHSSLILTEIELIVVYLYIRYVDI